MKIPGDIILVSYPLTTSTPLYPSSPKISFQSSRSISNGDSSNSFLIEFSNHSGTHLDLPKHFCNDGPDAAEILLPASEFTPSFCIDLSDRVLSKITPEDLKPHIAGKGSAEALLIRTGMAGKRHLPGYRTDYPFIDPEVPDFLRHNFPRLKVFCTDTISVANPQYREEGRACHRNFLCKKPYILILEDANLSDERICGESWILKIFPAILGNLDAVPVVAILELPPKTNADECLFR